MPHPRVPSQASGHPAPRHRGAIAMAAVLLLAALTLGGCGTMTSTTPVSVQADAAWVLLPIDNLSNTPLAGHAASALLETRLRALGAERVARLADEAQGTLVDLLEERPSREQNLRRARTERGRYALGGTVHEWHYKSAPGREPVVGLSLTLVEVASGRVLWQGSAAKSGWGEASLTELADRVIAELLEGIRMRRDDAGS